jgi:hypothetical protein
LALLAIASLIGSAVFAQSSPIRVKLVVSDNPESREVADALAGKIGSTSRYALVTTNDDVLINVGCQPIQRTDGRPIGTACTTTFNYWAVQTIAIPWFIGSTLTTGPASETAAVMFNQFVQDSSDENLKKARDTFKSAINVAIFAFPKGVQ